MLRKGSFTTAALLLAAALAIPLRPVPPAQAQARDDMPVDLELVLAVDVSLSIDSGEARLQRQGYVEAFRDPQVIEAIRSGILGRISVTYFEWANSSHNQLIVDWTLIDGPESAETFAAALQRRHPGPAHYTSISGAIDFGAQLFDHSGFEGTRQVIDISGDGPNNWGDLVVKARDRAVARGITINGLPILDEGPGFYARYNIRNLDLYYRDCVIGGPAAFIVVADGFTSFADAIRRKLILEIAGLSPDEPPAAPRQARAATLRLHLAQLADDTREAPPCDVGERLLRSRDEDF